MKLAIEGGIPVRSKFFPSQNTMGIEEKEAVLRVLANGRLSGYRANRGSHFMGGQEVQQFEEAFCEKFHVKHAIACNSATSGLFIAYAAFNGMLNQGDLLHKNINTFAKTNVTPWSMTCSATIPMWFNHQKYINFIDIEKDYFCLDISKIQENDITIAVSLFGQPINPDFEDQEYFVIEDAAQSLGSYFINEADRKIYAGTIGDIGVFSFNFGKHITCGEGGMLVCDDDDLAIRCRLIMNHAESVINDDPESYDDYDMIGLNLRMTELQAAVAHAQLMKFDRLLEKRLKNVAYLQKYLSQIPCISNIKERPNCTHTYYTLPFLFDSKKCDGIHRDKFIEAVKAELSPREGRDGEGQPIGCGYIKPIYRMPIFNIQKTLCPITEKLWKDDLFLTLYHAPNSTVKDMEDVVNAFEKVWENRYQIIREGYASPNES